jgi:hypothetical protein
MTPQEFSAKWADNELKESAASKEHFLDVCALVGSPTPRDADKQGDWFAFEKGVAKGSLAGVSSKNGRKKQGFADVFLRGSFAWEYKGPHKDLDGAYAQLQLYRDALENPPLMIVSDMDRFMVRTNFNDMAVEELAFTNQRSLEPLRRYAATPYTAKHRIFVWLDRAVLPDHQLVAFARDDDYFLGVLHSRPHELWALRKSNDMGKGNDPRYSPTVCFETFPLPFPPGEEPDHDSVKTVANAAHRLDQLRTGWMSADGVGEADRKKRTLTNLYNDRPTWLRLAHTALDRAVFAAYGWTENPEELPDEEILKRLLALNLERAAKGEAP